MMPQPPPKQKFTPHKVLKEGAVFVSVADSDNVLEIKPTINKVMRTVGLDDKPITNPDGTPVYQVQWNMNLIVLTKAEWNVKKQVGDL